MKSKPRNRKKRLPSARGADQRSDNDDRKTRKSKRHDDDDEVPRGKSKKSNAKQGRSFPVWLPIAVGGGVLAIAIVIVIAFSGRGDKKNVAGDNKPAPVAANANGNGNAPVVNSPLPKKEPDNSPPKLPPKNDLPMGPGVPVGPGDPSFVVNLPAMPPPDQRPARFDPGWHSSTVKRVFFSPDGKQAITVSLDKSIRITDIATGDTLKTIRLPSGPGNEGVLHTAAMAPDGDRIAVSGIPVGRGKYGALIYIVSLRSGTVERVFKGHRLPVQSLAFSPNKKWLASGAADNRAMVTDLDTGEIAGEMKGHTMPVMGVVFHPNDGRIATASADGTARIWTGMKDGFVSKELKGHTGQVACIAWSQDGKRLATGGTDGTIRLWWEDGTHQKTIEKEAILDRAPGNLSQTVVTSVAFLNNGEELLYTGVAGVRGQVGIVDIGSGQRRIKFDGHTNTVQHGSLSADSAMAISTGGNDDETHVWKTATGEIVQTFQPYSKAVGFVAWTADSKGFIWSKLNDFGPNAVNSFRLDTFEFAKRPENVLGPQEKLQGFTIAKTSPFELVVKFNGQDYWTYRISENEQINRPTLLPNGQMIVPGTFSVRLVDLKKKQEVRKFYGHSASVFVVAPNPQDPGMFLTGSADQTIRIWRVDKIEPVLSLFFAGREWIAWTPEGYYAASANGERLMGWQVNNGFDKVGSFYPAIQFRQSLFQPKVIRNLFRANGEFAPPSR